MSTPELERVSIPKPKLFSTLERKPMVVVKASTPLRDAIKMTHEEHEASFAVEDSGKVYVIEAAEMFEEVQRLFVDDSKRQLRAIRALCNSKLPVLKAFGEVGINPIRVAGSSAEMQSVLLGERLTVASSAHREFMLNRSDPTQFRIDRPIVNAFSCAWKCQSGKHLWPCACGEPPATCKNGKAWSQG